MSRQVIKAALLGLGTVGTGVYKLAKRQKEEIEKKLEILSASEEFGMILRAKGMLSDSHGEWTYFDMVPGEVEIRTGAPDYTGRICVIGSKLKEEKLAELFGV